MGVRSSRTNSKLTDNPFVAVSELSWPLGSIWSPFNLHKFGRWFLLQVLLQCANEYTDFTVFAAEEEAKGQERVCGSAKRGDRRGDQTGNPSVSRETEEEGERKTQEKDRGRGRKEGRKGWEGGGKERREALYNSEEKKQTTPESHHRTWYRDFSINWSGEIRLKSTRKARI